MSSSSPALDDDKVVSKDGETTRRWLPVVDSINLLRRNADTEDAKDGQEVYALCELREED
jgi:hypothetical protein